MYEYFDLMSLPILSRSRRVKQVSSYDRRYENEDWGHYLYDIDAETSVIFEDSGCGCIKSIWMAVPPKEAFLEFYFGGEETPRYKSTFWGFFNGECEGLSGIGNTFEERGHWEEADCRCGNCFIQIPYENGLRIIARGVEKAKCYYHIMYESYADGVIPDFGKKEIYENAFSEKRVSKARLEKYEMRGHYNDLITLEEPGVISEMTLRVPEDADISKLFFYICFDHARVPQIACPVPALFAQPCTWEDIDSYVLTSKRENGYVTTSLYLPMPFFEKVYIGIVNLSKDPYDIEFGVVIDENNYNREETGHFYADHREGPTVLFSDWNIGEFYGRGHVVGFSQSCVKGVGGSYCEGNEHFYIDGERTPSINGTGTEDIYLGCYWPNMKYESPCAGCLTDVYIKGDCDLRKSLDNPIMYYRYFLDMPIAFENGIKLDVQHGAVDQNFSDYTTTCFSYRQAVSGYRQTDYIRLSSEASREMHGYRADGEEYTLEGRLESDMRARPLLETGYKTEKGKICFKVAIDPENDGVVLRRLYDQSVFNANAKVYVDGELAGVWNTCNINTFFAFADSDFHIPKRLTMGKGSLDIEIVTDGIYTDFDYTVLS
ncbi:MAG: DUF2961 domain-containing protein [Ruminococcaceae bacterium]|nr:DUF2961 domain-containing protein [Oscillospiraceae bacterium]